MKLILLFSSLFLMNCAKETERIIERIPECNVAQCYITNEKGLYLQVFRDCALDFKAVKDPQTERFYWQVTLDNALRSVRRVEAHVCEWGA